MPVAAYTNIVYLMLQQGEVIISEGYLWDLITYPYHNFNNTLK